MSQFRYKALDTSRSIRLLQFLKGPKPVCNMITVEVEKAPPYVALSYTWGEKMLSNQIQVNGQMIPITANLGDAVGAIYEYARERNMMLWADSICINQADIQERSQQVRLMNTIYRSAEIVAIWLGAAADESELAFKVVERWKARFDILKEQCGGSEELAVNSISSGDRFFFGPRGSEERRALEALRKIARRPWWTRAWIVQEGTIAHPRRTILFCGQNYMDWACFRVALQITHHVTRYQISAMSADFGHSRTTRLDTFRKDRETGARIDLLRVLGLMRAYECEDPRDKIYAALGMAMDVRDNDIIPDYTKSCAHVYAEVVRFCISNQDGGIFDFLGYALRAAPGIAFQHDHSILLPSWVPDWTFQSINFPLEKSLNSDIYGEPKRAYNASGSFQGGCYIDNESLYAQGSVLDRVVSVSSICDRNLSSGGLRIVRSWTPHDFQDTYPTGATDLDAFNHTVTADIGRRDMEDDAELSRGFAIDWGFVDHSTLQLSVEERQRRTWMLVDTNMMTSGRRLFRTSRGFMGLGPAAAQVGDDVCVLLGGQVLYVVRGCPNDRFEFIGECYIHGMMDGQAVEERGFQAKEMVFI